MADTCTATITNQMGTSSSQGSPRSSRAWDAAKVAYQAVGLSGERISNLIWRAASSPESSIVQLLSSDIVQRCLEVGTQADSPHAALERMADAVIDAGTTNFGVDLARRAVVTSFQARDRYEAASQALFGEAARYLFTRDAPTLVGCGNRLNTLSDVASLERDVAENARVSSSRAGKAPKSSGDWQSYVSRVVKHLSKVS